MTMAMANLTQVINQSPQVGYLMGSYLAAVEEGRRQAQTEISQELQELTTKTVMALEDSGQVAAIDIDDRRRREAALTNRRRAERAARVARALGAVGAEVARDPFEPVPVIDLSV
jgi:hypothetical protein